MKFTAKRHILFPLFRNPLSFRYPNTILIPTPFILAYMYLFGKIMAHKLIFIVYFLCAYVVSMTLLLPLLATSCQIATCVAQRTQAQSAHIASV